MRRAAAGRRRRLGRIGIALLPVAVALVACRQPPSGPTATPPAARPLERAPDRPDILLVSIDSLRPDHLGCYGYTRPTSPTLDQLAAQGVRFTQAVSSTSWTLPAHAALFTGREEEEHGVTRNGLRLNEAQITLAEVLRDLGYQTAGFFAGPYLHPTFGLGQGFSTYASCMAGLSGELAEDQVREAAQAEAGPAMEQETGSCSVERFGAYLDQADARPAFLFVHLWDVHYDYAPPPPWDQAFDPDYRGAADFSRLAVNPAVHAAMDPRDREHLLALYDGEIRWTDSNVARLLELHAQRREGRELLVVVLSDHGEEFFEHGGKGHQQTLFEEVVRIPLIFHWPGHLPAGATVPGLVRIIDVFPTLLELVGATPPEPIAGRSLVALLRGGELPELPALLELRVHPEKPLAALRSARGKLLLGRWPAAPAYYDLATDPGELRPLAGRAELERAGLRDLKRRLVRAGDFLDRHPDRAPVGVRPDDEIARQLMALSYLGDGEK